MFSTFNSSNFIFYFSFIIVIKLNWIIYNVFLHMKNLMFIKCKGVIEKKLNVVHVLYCIYFKLF